MNYEDVLKYLAPCGLDCYRCAGYANGEIKQNSAELRQLLDGYGRLAKMRAAAEPVFDHFPQFMEILNSLSQGSCGGCRSENAQCLSDCAVRSCYKNKKVDFCWQCSEYPCVHFEGFLGERWRKMNDRMKEIGVIEYYFEQSKLPRY